MSAAPAFRASGRAGEWAPRYYACGESLAEIAQRLRCPIGTVLRALEDAQVELRPCDAQLAREIGR